MIAISLFNQIKQNPTYLFTIISTLLIIILLIFLFKKKKQSYKSICELLKKDPENGMKKLEQLEDIQLKQQLILEGESDLGKKLYQKVKKNIATDTFLKQLLEKEIICKEKKEKKKTALTLIKIASAQSIDYVIPLLYDNDKEIKTLIIRQLAKISNPKILTTLAEYLDYCNDVLVRETLKGSFKNLGKESIPKILELLNSDLNNINWLVDLLGDIDDKRTIKPLLDLLSQHHNHNIRISAAKGLSRFLDVDEVYNKLIENIEDDNPTVRAQIIKSIGKLDNPDVLSHLYEALKDTSGIVRSNAAQALLNHGDEGIKYLLLATENLDNNQKEIAKYLDKVDTLKLINLTKTHSILEGDYLEKN